MKCRYGSLGLLPIIALVPKITLAGDWYVAANVGESHYNSINSQAAQIDATIFENPLAMADSIPQLGVPTTISSNADRTGYRLTAGYQFAPSWGLEASYVDLGRATTSETTFPLSVCGNLCQLKIAANGTIYTRGWVISGTGTYHFSDQWSVIARVGAFNDHVSLNISRVAAFADGEGQSVYSSSEASSTSWRMTFGYGIAYDLTRSLSIRLDADQYRNLGNSSTTEGSIHLVSTALVYRF